MRFRIGLGVVIVLIGIYTGVTSADRARGAVLFLTIGPGARAAGMGESFVAIADDPTSTYWNPAGLGRYPLSSRWYDFSLQEDGLKYFASVKTSRADIDFRRFDQWVANETSLWLLRRDRWFSMEEYIVEDPDGESVNSILREFTGLSSYDSAYAKILKQKVMSYNSLTDSIVPMDTKIEIPFEYFVPESITALASTEKILWIGTKAGLYRYVSGIWKKMDEPESPKGLINILAVDDRDNLWVGTPSGLYQKQGSKWKHYSTSEGLPSNQITAIYAASNRNIWVGTQRGPANFKGAAWKTDFLYKVPEHVEWVETGEDTSMLAKTKISWEELVEELCGAKGTQRKHLLIANLKAHNRIPEADTPPGEIMVPYNLVLPAPVSAIYVDQLERVWIGSSLGLVRFDTDKIKVFGWRAVTIDNDISIEDFVNSKWSDISETTKQHILEKIRAFGFINNINLKNGEVVEVPSNPVSGVIYDMDKGFTGSDVLIATEYGLLRYYPQLHQFRYIMTGGLQDKTVTHLENHSGEYWFGTNEAVNIYSQGKPGVSLMHVRWLPELAEDIYYEYLTGVYYLEDWGTIGGAVTFISLGKSEQTNEAGEVLGTFYSYETALTGSYGVKFFPNLYAGVNFKVIYSALAPQIYVGHEKKSGTGTTFAVDIGFLYDGPISGLSFGACAQHLGPDIHYIDAAQADPLPRNLKVGMAYRVINTDYQKLIVAADVNKEIIQFKSPENSWMLEWRYAVKHIGLEYSYSNFFSLRGGYIIDYDFYPKSDSLEKINADNYDFDSGDYTSVNYFTFGVGLHYGNFTFDFAYIPRVSDPENKGANLPLSNIQRFSMTMEF